MSENLETQKETGATPEEGQVRESAAVEKPSRGRLVVLLLILVSVAIINVLETREMTRLESDEHRRAALVALRLSASEIDEYFRANNSLPEALESLGLNDVVEYRPLSNNEFELRMRFGPHETQVLRHDASQPLHNDVLSTVFD